MAAQQDSVVSTYSPSLRGKRVLVLEDRLLNQNVIQKQLKKLGIDCVLAADGVKGLEMLAHQQFDLILCDCSMPMMNGYEFTQALRLRESARRDGHHMPVIALTANAFREDVERCLKAGMDDFISKPVTMDRLAAMLVRWLSPPGTTATAAVDQEKTDDIKVTPMIDIRALAEILGTNKPEMLNEVLAEFVGVAGNSLSNVEAAVTSGDPDRIKLAAHGAKGEARCAAAIGLAGLYSELERRAKDDDRAVSLELLIRTAVEVKHVRDFIQERLGGHVS